MTGYIEAVLNEAAIRNGNLDFINPPIGFFPADCFGTRSAEDKGKLIRLRVNGELVETDIRQKSNSIVSPRKRFYALFQHTFHAKPGDKVRLVRLGEREYDFQYLRAKP